MKLFVLAMLLILALPGCATMTALGAIEACSVWPYTTWDVKDTDQTIAGNKVNNARKKAFCEGYTP